MAFRYGRARRSNLDVVDLVQKQDCQYNNPPSPFSFMPNHSRVFVKQPVCCNNSIRFRKNYHFNSAGFYSPSPKSLSLALMQTDKQSLTADPHSALTPRDLNSRQFVSTFVPCHVTAMHKKIFIVTSILCNTPVRQTNLIYVTMTSFCAAVSGD